MTEKKYLKWYNKLGYGSGDAAACLTYALVTQFVMIYLTDSVGLASGIVGTLIMASKILDGISDIFFGHLIDKTHTRMGRARPWMFYAQFGVSICVVALFSIPNGISQVSQYVWFFVSYTMMNAIFYTANNIAYAALTALITKNPYERVEVGVVRFCFSLATNIFVAYAGVRLSPLIGWGMVALIFTVFAIIINTISVFSVRELPDDELYDRNEQTSDVSRPGIIESVILCFTNRYFISLLLSYLFYYILNGFNGISIYYFTYIMKNVDNYSIYSSIYYFPMLIGLLFTPYLIKKAGMYKSNLYGFAVAIIARVLFAIAGYMGNFPFMLVSLFLFGLGTAPLTGDQNALIAESSEYTYRRKGKRVDGMMYSCASMGNKIGTGIGTAVYGILLQCSGYVQNAAQQNAATMQTINFCFLIVPLILTIALFIDLLFLNVEKANSDWDKTHSIQ